MHHIRKHYQTKRNKISNRHKYLHVTGQFLDQDIRYQVVVQQTTIYLYVFFPTLTNSEHKWFIEQYGQSLLLKPKKRILWH
jgi:hypothetical protein